MRYEEAVSYLYALTPRGVKLGLSRMQEALVLRGHPERAFRSLLVAGTNGKGSVAATLSSVLCASGTKVGLFTSPHLHQLVERFRINGRPISKAELARRVTELAPFLESDDTPELTFFEVTTLLAFEIFRDHGCAWAVLEVGLGGRLDATNVVTPEVSVITKIALDHADRLGNSLRDIAREKAGILRPKVPVVLGVRAPEAQKAILAKARRLGCPTLVIERDFHAERTESGYRVQVADFSFSRLKLALSGDYQADNLACALAVVSALRARGVDIPDRAIRAGVLRTRWPGRLELLEGAPSVLLDAAHNPDACLALAAYLRELRPKYAKIVLLFGVMVDKEYAAMLKLLLPEVDAHVFATPHTARALPASSLGKKWGGDVRDEPVKAFRRAQKIAGKRGLVVAAGSIFLMSAVRSFVLGLASDPPIAM